MGDKETKMIADIKRLLNKKDENAITKTQVKYIFDALNNINDSLHAVTNQLVRIAYHFEHYDKERINALIKQDSTDNVTELKTRIRPCIYFDNDVERSVAFHTFNGNMAIVEFTDGSVKEVPISDIKFLDSEISLTNFNRINNVECLKQYWENEECFKKRYESLKKEYPELFKDDSNNK